MEVEIQLTHEPIVEKISPPATLDEQGAWLEFRGVVRNEENGQKISALEYEAYSPMAENEMRHILESLAEKFPCLAVKIIHRVGIIPVGETAIYVGIGAVHRGEAIGLLTEFMNRLKQDVPIWKRRGLSVETGDVTPRVSQDVRQGTVRPASRSLDEALAEVRLRCKPLPAVSAPLAEAFGRVLRKTVCATEDLPSANRSTRDGYASLMDDFSESFQVVDTLHAADWNPRSLKPGEVVRVATGAAMPAEGLRVIMQEDVERNGDRVRVLRREHSRNIRLRGEDMQKGQPLVPSGTRLDAGAMALLASIGCVEPLVSRRLRVCHFTTGDEIIPPNQMPKPGQIRDSNSILIHGLLQRFDCEVKQAHLPEDFEKAKKESEKRKAEIENADVILVSGGASVGDKDFTRELFEWLGFEIIFNRVNIRPGAPLIFGVNGSCVAFGLPGNPLSHFVCFHSAVAAALSSLIGETPPMFLRGRLDETLDDKPCPRETLWPARLEWRGVEPRLRPLSWASSGDITCLVSANALVRVPANSGVLEKSTEVNFLPAATFGLQPSQSSHKLDATTLPA